MSRSCSCRPKPASTLRRRPRFFLGAALAAAGAGAAFAAGRGFAGAFAAALGAFFFFFWADLGMGTLWSPCDTEHRVQMFKLSSGNRLTLQERPDKMPCSFRNAVGVAPNIAGASLRCERASM